MKQNMINVWFLKQCTCTLHGSCHIFLDDDRDIRVLKRAWRALSLILA